MDNLSSISQKYVGDIQSIFYDCGRDCCLNKMIDFFDYLENNFLDPADYFETLDSIMLIKAKRLQKQFRCSAKESLIQTCAVFNRINLEQSCILRSLLEDDQTNITKQNEKVEEDMDLCRTLSKKSQYNSFQQYYQQESSVSISNSSYIQEEESNMDISQDSTKNTNFVHLDLTQGNSEQVIVNEKQIEEEQEEEQKINQNHEDINYIQNKEDIIINKVIPVPQIQTETSNLCSNESKNNYIEEKLIQPGREDHQAVDERSQKPQSNINNNKQYQVYNKKMKSSISKQKKATHQQHQKIEEQKNYQDKQLQNEFSQSKITEIYQTQKPKCENINSSEYPQKLRSLISQLKKVYRIEQSDENKMLDKYLKINEKDKIFDQKHFNCLKQIIKTIIKNFIEYTHLLLLIKDQNCSKEIIKSLKKIKQLSSFCMSQNSILTQSISVEQKDKAMNSQLIQMFLESAQFELRLYQSNLPSYFSKEKIYELMYKKEHSNIFLLMGETGSGKTTQVPQMLYQLNNFDLSSSRKQKGKIICVQPRRIACLSVCEYVRSQMKSDAEAGLIIDWFQDKQDFVNKDIVFITESIFLSLFITFLKSLKDDKISQESKRHKDMINLFQSASHIIIDEIHERNLKTDLIIGLVHKYLSYYKLNQKGEQQYKSDNNPKNEQNKKNRENHQVKKQTLKTKSKNTVNLQKYNNSNKNDQISTTDEKKKLENDKIKFILSSATMNEESLSIFFKEMHLEKINISGRQYYVKLEYLKDDNFHDMKTRVVKKLEEIIKAKENSNRPCPHELEGHILVFLSSQIEIREVLEETIRQIDFNENKYQLLQLHAKQSRLEQQKAFQERAYVTKIIFATNLAEASMTIDNVSVVIDTGQERTNMFDEQKNSNVIKQQSISHAQADQRKGRAGRTRPGICFRLYSENDFNNFKQEREPEIKRTNLSLTILQILELGVGDISDFPFLDRPSQQKIDKCLETLLQFKAISQVDNIYTLTKIGKFISMSQLEPTLARILLQAHYLGVEDEVMKAESFFEEFQHIMPLPQNDRDSQKQKDFYSNILSFGIQKQAKVQKVSQSSQAELPINSRDSDFIFFWKSYEFINEIKDYKRMKSFNLSYTAFQRAKQKYEEMKKAFQLASEFFLDSSMDQHLKDQMIFALPHDQKVGQSTDEEKCEYIVKSFFCGHENKIAVYSGIHNLSFYNKQSNSLFFIHPTSSLMKQMYTKDNGQQQFRQFRQGDFIFYHTLEERERKNYVKGVSYFSRKWLHNEQLILQLEESAKFDPFFAFACEKEVIEMFSRLELPRITSLIQEYQRGTNSDQLKARYCILSDRDRGKVSFYCNPEMQTFLRSLDLAQIFTNIQDIYRNQLKEERIVIRYKDSFNYTVLASGLQIKEIVLPNNFIQVKIINIPFKCPQILLQRLISLVENEAPPQERGKKSRAAHRQFKICTDFVNTSSFALISFDKSRRARTFFKILSDLNSDQTSKIFKEVLRGERGQQKMQISCLPIPECEFLLQANRNLSKCLLIAQWSLAPSLQMGHVFFNNDIDAISTFESLRRAGNFKVQMREGRDQDLDSITHYILIDKLPPNFDEVDLEAYIVNTYQGLVSFSIKREKLNNSAICNSNIIESIEKSKFVKLILENLPGLLSETTKSLESMISIYIKNSTCIATIELDSLTQAQLLVDKLNGIEYGEQKLRLQIQNKQTIPILGSVYLLCFDQIQICLKQSEFLVNVRAPKRKEVLYLSKNIYIHLQQISQGSLRVLHELQHNIENIVKFHTLYLDCDPANLYQLMQNKKRICEDLEKKYNCVIRQLYKRASSLKIWFGKLSTPKYIHECKKDITRSLNVHLIGTLNLKRVRYNCKKLDELLQQKQNIKQIMGYSTDKNSIIVRALKSKLLELKAYIDHPDNRFITVLAANEQEDACLICCEIKDLERLACLCLFCKDCLFKYVKTQSQENSTLKPLLCPNHKDTSISISILSTILDSNAFHEIVQLRIDRAIDDFILSSVKQPTFIRCPSVNCNEFFMRYYDIPQQTIKGIQIENKISTKSDDCTSFLNPICIDYQKFPYYVKCNGCYFEYCLASSGKRLDRIDLNIHHTHPNISCEQYFQQQSIEQKNIKGIPLISCPKCKFKAIKGDGCNHISCKCGAHFCAKCEESFPTAKEVYDHLHLQHQGLF